MKIEPHNHMGVLRVVCPMLVSPSVDAVHLWGSIIIVNYARTVKEQPH